jgi:hypothetical protein
MTAVVVEFQKREKIGAKAIVADASTSAQVIIFPGVRQERLTEGQAPVDESQGSRSPRRKKTS